MSTGSEQSAACLPARVVSARNSLLSLFGGGLLVLGGWFLLFRMEVVAYQLLRKHENLVEVNRFAVPEELILVQLDQPVNIVKNSFFFLPLFWF